MKKLVFVLMCFALMIQLAECQRGPGDSTRNPPKPNPTPGKRSVDAQLDGFQPEIQSNSWEPLDKDGGHH
jgi:hypothetical protein